MEEVFVVCACHSPEHTIQLSYYPSDNELLITTHLTNHRFFRRLWLGLKYIAGKQSRYGHFEEHLFDNQNCGRMLELFGRIKNEENNER